MTISKAQGIIALISAVIAIGAPAWVSMKSDAEWRGSIDTKIEAQSDMLAQSTNSRGELFEAKLKPIAEAIDDLEQEVRVTQSNVASMEVTTTQGADANTRLLAGRITLIQEDLIMMESAREVTTQEFRDSLSTLRQKLTEIEALTEPVVITDTLTVEIEKEEGGGGFLGIKNLFN